MSTIGAREGRQRRQIQMYTGQQGGNLAFCICVFFRQGNTGKQIQMGEYKGQLENFHAIMFVYL